MIFRLRVIALFACLISFLPSGRSLALTVPPPDRVVTTANANLRAKPTINGEILATARAGASFKQIGSTTLPKAVDDEPRTWITVLAPAGTRVWILADLVDPATKAVRVPKANLRAGPGRNYSNVGALMRGTVIEELRAADGWIQIASPEGAVIGHIAADLVQPESPAPSTRQVLIPPSPRQTPLPPNPGPLPTSTGRRLPPTPVVTPQPLAPNPLPPAVALVPPPVQPEPAEPSEPSEPISEPVPVLQPPVRLSQSETLVPAVSAFSPASGPVQPSLEYTALPRQVIRQGVVKMALDPHAPANYQLDSFRKGEGFIAFIHSDSDDLKIADWHRKQVVVVGEEYIDPRWPKHPVIQVKSIDLAY
jgi:hypothetical protein